MHVAHDAEMMKRAEEARFISMAEEDILWMWKIYTRDIRLWTQDSFCRQLKTHLID